MGFQINKKEFLKNIFVRIEPTDEKGQLRCVDSSDKKEIGKTYDIYLEYNIYLVNNSEYDIQRVFSEKQETYKGDEYGSLKSRERLLLYVQESWEFDWTNIWDVNLQFDKNNTMKIFFKVPYGGCEQKPYDITVSDQHPYDWIK